MCCHIHSPSTTSLSLSLSLNLFSCFVLFLQLADLLHLRPDHFAVDWFLPVCFGGTPPPGTPLANLEGGIASNTGAVAALNGGGGRRDGV